MWRRGNPYWARDCWRVEKRTERLTTPRRTRSPPLHSPCPDRPTCREWLRSMAFRSNQGMPPELVTTPTHHHELPDSPNSTVATRRPLLLPRESDSTPILPTLPVPRPLRLKADHRTDPDPPPEDDPPPDRANRRTERTRKEVEIPDPVESLLPPPNFLRCHRDIPPSRNWISQV